MLNLKFKAIASIMLMSLLFSTTAFAYENAWSEKEFRGIWVATVMNLDYPQKAGLSVSEMKVEALEILDGAVRMGMNAIIFQVRPATDALYKSEIFPWSIYLTGEQGLAPADEPENGIYGFDPLEYWVEQAHIRGLELHAWVNPYRISHFTQKLKSIDELSENNPARLNPDWVYRYSDGGYYFNPGLPEVRDLIIDGIAEILENYDVDGIHLDDYFYPGTEFADNWAYMAYGGGMSRDDWRRENVNILIREIQSIVKEIKPGASFGVSPFAIWQNKGPESPLGSDTRGMEAYKTIYSDTLRWVKEGWLDYICPQIYWNINYPAADYAKLLSWWADACEGTGVDLYIGHAAYKEAESKDAAWKGEILRQLKLNTEYPIVKGSIFFRYGSINDVLADSIRNFYFNIY